MVVKPFVGTSPTVVELSVATGVCNFHFRRTIFFAGTATTGVAAMIFARSSSLVFFLMKHVPAQLQGIGFDIALHSMPFSPHGI
jgi:hypothetical protein